MKLSKVSIVYPVVTKTIDSRYRIVEVATEHFMRLGLRSVSMDDVARAAGVSKKTVYQHFENKRALIKQVMETDFEKDMAAVTANHQKARDAIDEMLLNSRYFIREMRNVNPTMLRDMQKYYRDLHEAHVVEHLEAFRQNIEQNIDRGMEEGLFRADLDPELVSKLYINSMMLIIDTRAFPAREQPVSELVTQISTYHFHAIVNAFGRDRLDDYLKQESLD